MTRTSRVVRVTQTIAIYSVTLTAVAGATVLAMPSDSESEPADIRLASVIRGAPEPLASTRGPSPGFAVDGTVYPRHTIELTSPITGRISGLNESAEIGGTIPRGEAIWVVEDSDYRARLDGIKHDIQSAHAQTEIERGKARAAKREWAALGMDEQEVIDADRRLSFREPQLAQAEAQVARLMSDKELAQADLKRCSKVLEYDLKLLSESIEEGEWVEAGQVLATGMRPGEWQVIARLTPAQVDRIQDAGFNGVQISVVVLGSSHEPLRAEVVRWLPGEIDQPQMRGLLLRVSEPTTDYLWSGATVVVNIQLRATESVDTPLAVREGINPEGDPPASLNKSLVRTGTNVNESTAARAQ